MRRLLLVSMLCSACTCGPGIDIHTDGGGGHGGGSGTGGGNGGTGGGSGAACDMTTPCSAGSVCIGGACCASANACGDTCCSAAGSACLYSRCVVPGHTCNTANDCAAGEYCETGFGADAGTIASDAGTCTQPLAPPGRCVALPPRCAPDAGPSDGGCLDACEYRADAGPLTAVARWSWGANARTMPDHIDVWSTPAIGRVFDANCDGRVDALDPPNVIFVSGRAISMTTGLGTCCQCTGNAVSACLTGVLRVLDGKSGTELLSLAKPSPASVGFSGVSVAIGDIDNDGSLDIAAVSGEGNIVLLDAHGVLKRTSNVPIPGHGDATFGWGGGLALADMEGDGFPELAYGSTVFDTTGNAITLRFTGDAGIGGGNIAEAISTFVDLDNDGVLELLAGNTAYRADGGVLWSRGDLNDGFPAVGDFDKNGQPEVVLVAGGNVTVLAGATGATVLPSKALGGTGFGGPPTVADFDGDKRPEIGVAQANFYTVLKPDFVGSKLDVLWQKANHDLSSSVTGSSVFDFEGDGRAEVIYADECFLWVFDGPTGAVRFAAPHTSFTATESSVVADVDGDGRAEMLMVSNSADPSFAGWKCKDNAGVPMAVNGVTWTPGPALGQSYRGVVSFGDVASGWVGTRTLWNEHTYHVSNICDDRDSACGPPNRYGSIPRVEQKNWSLPWLNDFRQNVQDKGLFDAPDAVVSLAVVCESPVQLFVFVRNIGLASLPAGVDVEVLLHGATGDTVVGTVTTTHPLAPGQTEELKVTPSAGTGMDTFFARIVVNPAMPKFRECRADNDVSALTPGICVQ